MTMSVVGLSIDSADPIALAGFWAEVLGRPVNPGATTESAAIDARLIRREPTPPAQVITAAA